jgi:hypothetical protein
MQPNLEGQKRAVKPESLEAKFLLLTRLPYNKRACRKHCLVFGFIVDWYHSKYGDALASVRHVVDMIKERDPAAKGLYAGDVHSALSDLVAWGFLHQEKGKGRRASRYVPNWSLVCSVQDSPNAKQDDGSVLDSPNASVRDSPNATADSIRDSTNEDPPTDTRLKTAVSVGVNNVAAAPLAPPAPGLAAGAAGTAGFERLWKAYLKLGNKAKARAEFSKIVNPDVEHIIGRAASWAASAKPGQKRMPLERWLADERYDEADRLVARKPAAPRKLRGAVAGDGAAEPTTEPVAKPESKPARHRATIIASRLAGEPGERCLLLTFLQEDGCEVEHCMVLDRATPSKQKAADLEMHRLCHASGLSVMDDTDQLIGRELILRPLSDVLLLFEPVPANDVVPSKEAA